MTVSTLRTSPLGAYVALGVFSLALLGAMGYVLYTGATVTHRHVPLVRASGEIKLDTTLAHLWFEEILTGDRHESMDEVWDRLAEARRDVRAMIEGSSGPEPTIAPLDDPRLRDRIRQIDAKLAEFEAITAERWNARQVSASGTEIDQAYDAAFRDFIALTDEVELELHEAIRRDVRSIRTVQSSVIAGAVGVLVLFGILFGRYTRQRGQFEEALELKVRAEEEAQRHLEELAHVVRQTTMSELAAGIAHEINQPLAAISTAAAACRRLIETGRGQSAEHLGAMKLIGDQASRASVVVKRLRAFVGKRQSKYEIVDLNDLVESVIKLGEFDPQMRELAIRLELARDLPPVEADVVQIQQVLLNLVRNGSEACRGSPGKTITIRTRVGDPDEIEVSVIDRGVGIADEIAGETFHPFFTTKESGMGMGLALSHSIISAHGGRIWFRANEQGPGTTFLFTLPTATRIAS